MCSSCQIIYYESCFADKTVPVCIAPACDLQCTISLLKTTELQKFVPDLLIATKANLKISDTVLAKIEIEKRIQKIREDIQARQTKLQEILPAGLRGITKMIAKSDGAGAFKKAKEKIIKDSKCDKFKECPRMSCIGFISSITMTCSVCEKSICDKCQEICEESHQCNKDILESVQFIKKSTQVCPKCRIPIHKASGCNHMWCTNCKTKFNYSNGEIYDFGYVQPEEGEYIKSGVSIKAKIHTPAIILEPIVRSKAPEDLLRLFDDILKLVPTLNSNNVEQLQLKLQSEKITTVDYDKRLLHAHESDYLSRTNKKQLVELSESLYHFFQDIDANTELKEALSNYSQWRNNFNRLYKQTYSLP